MCLIFLRCICKCLRCLFLQCCELQKLIKSKKIFLKIAEIKHYNFFSFSEKFSMKSVWVISAFMKLITISENLNNKKKGTPWCLLHRFFFSFWQSSSKNTKVYIVIHFKSYLPMQTFVPKNVSGLGINIFRFWVLGLGFGFRFWV